MKAAVTETAWPCRKERPPSSAASAHARQPTSIVTRMRFAASPERVWHGLMFYEQIEERPPLHLRLLLPRPIRTEGRKSKSATK